MAAAGRRSIAARPGGFERARGTVQPSTVQPSRVESELSPGSRATKGRVDSRSQEWRVRRWRAREDSRSLEWARAPEECSRSAPGCGCGREAGAAPGRRRRHLAQSLARPRDGSATERLVTIRLETTATGPRRGALSTPVFFDTASSSAAAARPGYKTAAVIFRHGVS